jgi:hypothetical protein
VGLGCPDKSEGPVPPSASNPEISQPQGKTAAEADTSPEAVEVCTWQSPLEAGIPGSPGNLIASEINPNGASELSVLMRKMVDDLREIRQGILNGAPPAQYPADHHRMRCTWPTDPDVRNPLFDGMAKSYLVAYDRLKVTKDSHAARYEAVLDGCVGCHSNTCQGPIPLIESLRLPAVGP